MLGSGTKCAFKDVVSGGINALCSPECPLTPPHLVRKTLTSTRRLIKSVDESTSAVAIL